ncbi:MAG: DegT/DnrJ/EryC1/StrS family aminotransferase [Pseudomonadota bacterium]
MGRIVPRKQSARIDNLKVLIEDREKQFRQISDLAIFGTSPAFLKPLHVGRPNIGNRQDFLGRVEAILDERWFSNNGPMVREFESRVAVYLGVKHCIAMCNGTIALEIAIRALELRDEVIIPSFTFVATAHALQWQGITPVFADIDPATYTLDPTSVERMITPRTTGILGVHVWGHPCAVEQLQEIADRHRLKVIYDAAHAFACSHGGKMIGNFGECEVLSFHATKFLNSFEGGAIVTNNDALAEKSRLIRNFGFKGADKVIYLGINGKMPEICAAMGLTGLEAIDDTVSVNERNYERYASHLSDIPGLELVKYSETDRVNYQYVVVKVGNDFPCTRDDLVRILHAENILVRRYFYPGCHEMQPYQSYFPNAGLLLPHTMELCDRVVSFPTGTAVSELEVDRIAEILRFVAKHGKDIQLSSQ